MNEKEYGKQKKENNEGRIWKKYEKRRNECIEGMYMYKKIWRKKQRILKRI